MNSEHEEGADAMAQKKAGDSAIWGLLNITSFTAEVHRSHMRIERGSEEKKGSAGGFGSSSGHRRLGRGCSRTFPFSRRRDGWWFRSGSPICDTVIARAWRKCAEMVD